jgi:pyruvate kinase
MPRTKIVCTLGPATDPPGTLEALLAAGMNVARLNFSHGTSAEHAERIERVRQAAARAGLTVAVLGDLQGPKLRIGDLPAGGRELARDEEIVLALQADARDARAVPLPHPELVSAAAPGHRLLLDDGQIELRVESKLRDALRCRVLQGGRLGSRKGVSVPDTELALSSLTPKDRDDARFAVQQDVDYLALSFVRSAADVRELRDVLHGLRSPAHIVAKIEKRQALDAFDDILSASDAVMVARGDLGVETPAEEVPVHQKSIIRACNRAGKPVITATQMLQSMIDHPHPTRAEASDVANAILDGSDAVMLSAETSVGKYPVHAVEVMARIAERTEPHVANRLHDASGRIADATDAVAQSAVEIASNLGARAIVSATLIGYAAGRIARFRPATPVFAVTPDPRVQRRLALVWGVQPWAIPWPKSADELLELTFAAVRRAGVAVSGDTLVLTGAVPVDARGRTNFLKVHVLE